MCFCCVSHFAKQLLHLPHLNKVEQVGEGARVEQGDVAGGKAHLRVGRDVYGGGVYDGGVGGGRVVYHGGVVYSGRNLQELVLVLWCGGHGCEEIRKSTKHLMVKLLMRMR